MRYINQCKYKTARQFNYMIWKIWIALRYCFLNFNKYLTKKTFFVAISHIMWMPYYDNRIRISYSRYHTFCGQQPQIPVKFFNYQHSSLSMVIESSFEALKAGFPTLKVMPNYKPTMQWVIVTAYCKIHNYTQMGMVQHIVLTKQKYNETWWRNLNQ